jgi:hypothetical protein
MSVFYKIFSFRNITIAGLCFSLLACSDDDGDRVISSENIPTNRIFATIDIYSDTGNKGYASIQLTKDTPPVDGKPDDEYIDITGHDQLWMSTGTNLEEVDIGSNLFSGLENLSNVQELFEGEYRGFNIFPFFFFWSALHPTQIHYNGSLDHVADGATYTVSLFRDNQTDAKKSIVTMPLAFNLIEPTASSSISRSNDNIQITWLPVENNVFVEASFNTSCSGSTLANYSYTVKIDQDNGTALINAGAINDNTLSGTCNTTLTLAKRRNGTLDSAYTGGYITANQVRTISFITVD